MRRPHFPHRSEDFERVAAAVFQRAAVAIGAQIGQRGDEARQQVAVCAVQLQPVKTGLHGVAGRLDKLRLDAVHVLRRHRHRHSVVWPIRHGAGSQQRPVAGGQRLVRGFPTDLGRALRPAVAQLHAHAHALTRAVRESDDAFPNQHLLVVPQAGTAGGDAAFGAGRGHLGKHHGGTAQRARAQVHQVKVLRCAVNGAVSGHRRNHDAVFEEQLAHLQRQQHGRRHQLGPHARHTSLFILSLLKVAFRRSLVFQAGAAGPALPDRRRSSPSGGQRITRSEKRGGSLFTSRGRGTGFAGPQAQHPLGGQRITRSEKRGGLFCQPLLVAL